MRSMPPRVPIRTDRISLAISLAAAAVVLIAGVTYVDGQSAPSSAGSALSTRGVEPTVAIDVSNLSNAAAIAPGFWGLDLSANARYSPAYSAQVAATPAKYLRFPGGVLGERYNYTSGRIISANGTWSRAGTNLTDFISVCQAVNCSAILQLPTEINSTATATYFVRYIVDTMHFQPAYWELGASPSGWAHFNISWNDWNGTQSDNATPVVFADVVHSYIVAIRDVDPTARFLALGTGIWPPDFAQAWVETLTRTDGHLLSGVSLGSYPISNTTNTTPPNASLANFFAALEGNHSMTAQVDSVRAAMLAGCPTCKRLQVFLTEANAAQWPTYAPYMATFNGSLFIAADVITALKLHLTNVDWYCLSCNYTGALETSAAHQRSQYVLFTQILDRLQNRTVVTRVHGSDSIHALATYGPAGLALLVVNLNLSHAVVLNLQSAGFCSSSPITEYYWPTGEELPVATQMPSSASPNLSALSIALLTQATCSPSTADSVPSNASVGLAARAAQ
jgi:hypothetical protein